MSAQGSSNCGVGGSIVILTTAVSLSGGVPLSSTFTVKSTIKTGCSSYKSCDSWTRPSGVTVNNWGSEKIKWLLRGELHP